MYQLNYFHVHVKLISNFEDLVNEE